MEAAKQKTVNRAATAQPAASIKTVQNAVQPIARAVQTQSVQASSVKVSSPKDSAEQEADSTAKKIIRMALPHTPVTGGPFAQTASAIQRESKEDDKKEIKRKAEGQPNVTSNVMADIQSSMTAGTPLSPTVRSFMEPRFRADFSSIKIHTNDKSAQLNRQVSARAFTFGNHIFFGKDQYQPEHGKGKELIAHELTHTIQQGAAPQTSTAAAQAPASAVPNANRINRSADVSVSNPVISKNGPSLIQRLGLSDALDYFVDRANLIPGFRMFTIILGMNPITMNSVDRSAANILRAVVEFMPGGALITQALDNHGVFNRVGDWIAQQIRTLGMTGDVIRRAVNRFLDSLSWGDIFNLGGVWERARHIFSEPIDRIISFVRTLAIGVLQFIKDAILMPLARLAEGTRGWDLLCAVLGRNPITGEAVPRNADTLIGGFMKLIGQEEVWENIKRGNAVARAWAWFQGTLAGVMAFVQQIPSLFVQALQSLQIEDILQVPRAFARVTTTFGSFALHFFTWAGEQVMSLLQIIFEVVAPQVMVYIRRAGGALQTIIRNPVGFVGNLVRAGVLGLRQFAANFLTHLRASLIGWLTGAMSGANIYIPQAFSLPEIIKFILSVLGLTWQNIRQKLVRAVGESTVAALETGFDIVVTLVREGPAAAWQKILESINNLREMVMEQIMSFVQNSVVQAAITRLVTSLNPAGAFIQAIIATYNTIMFFVERLQQIGRVVAAFIDSIAAIASGVISAAANRVEQTMAGMLTLVISFLARIAGLGRVSDAVINIINRVRQPIDRALDRVVDWVVTQARRLGRAAANTARSAAAGVSGWWRAHRAIRGSDGINHELYFVGEGRTAQLILASNPMPVEQFLNSIQDRSDYQSQLKRALISQVRQQVQTIRRAQALPDSQAADIDRQIDAAFAAMSPLLAQLVGGGDFATQTQPLPLAYPKRRWSTYPIIYIGPRAANPVRQADLADRRINFIQSQLSPTERAEWETRGNAITAYRPTESRTLPGGQSIGLSGDYAVEPGKKIRLVPQATAGGGLINRILYPYGYRASSERMDGDHVVEMQLGGPNIPSNLWPLDASENRSSGSVISRMRFRKPDSTEITMDALKSRARGGNDVWFIITSTR